MLVEGRMSRPVIAITPDMPIHDARNLFKQEQIRRAPVVKNGKLVGIVSDQDLIDAAPSQATTLSVWEMNYLLSKIVVKDIMTKDVMQKITEAVTAIGGNFISFGQFTGEDVATKLLTFKVVGAKQEDVKKAIWDIAKEVWDIRECCY